MFQNLDLFAVGFATAAIGILGFVVIFNNRRSVTNQSFLFFSLATILYSVFNYLTYQFSNSLFVLWTLRLAVFFVVWHAFGIFQVFYIFPKEKFVFPKLYNVILVPVVALTAIITLTPLVFVRVAEFYPDGRVATVINGPAIALFGIVVSVLVLGGVFLLLRKTLRASGIEKTQFRFVLVGAMITFPLYIFFNFMLPALYDNSRFIPFAPVFSLPFTVLTAYAIVRHHLLKIKVIATEFLAFLLVVASFFEIILAKSLAEIIFRSGVFVVLLFAGILLIRSVRREVEQREKLQVLTQKLEEVNLELQRLDQAKSEFISIASHQLRAPLTVIKGYISLILEGTLGKVEDKIKNVLGNVFTATNQLVKLVADMLDLSRVESGKIQYQFAENDFVGLVGEVVRDFGEVAKKKEVGFSFKNLAGEVLKFRFDRDKLREVVVNLIDNGLKYSKKNGETLVKLERVVGSTGEGVIRFSVKDDGIGVKEKDKDLLFAKFVRSDEAKAVDPGGMGIGLYFAKRVVEDHKGKVGVESEGVGKGSTFWVEIPIR